jgi:hypothetical protein
MASTDTSDPTRPEKLEHPDFWARQRARMHDPAELRHVRPAARLLAAAARAGGAA